MTRYLSSDKNTRRNSRRTYSPPPSPPPASSTQHSSSPLSSSSKSSPSPQPSSEASSENRLSAKLEKQLAAAGEDVEETSLAEEEDMSGLPGLPYIPDPDYATPYIPCPATPSPDYEERERNPMDRDLWGNARRYRGKQESAADPTRTLKEALKNRFAVHL